MFFGAVRVLAVVSAVSIACEDTRCRELWASVTDLNARNSDNDFERVAAQVVSAGLYCNRLHDSWQQLAADQAANLYATMSCQGSASGPDGDRSPAATRFASPRPSWP